MTLRLGYSFWGFIGHGVTDTPDGGRSHRRTLLSELTSAGVDLILLQPNRDQLEANDAIDLGPRAVWDSHLPGLDALMLEWRWPIPGRNTQDARGNASYTPDLDRQHQLLAHYTEGGVPTIIWDKDLRLPARHPLRLRTNVKVLEAAAFPRNDAGQLLFPIADKVLAQNPIEAQEADRPLPLTYIGNQYDRDEHFDRWFAPAARVTSHAVYGKWTQTTRWPDVVFCGRVPFDRAMAVYRRATTTVALLPDRYRACGQMTQRLAEAVLNGCVTMVPGDIRGAELFAPRELVLRRPSDVLGKLRHLLALDSDAIGELRLRSLAPLHQFRASAQVDRILDHLMKLK